MRVHVRPACAARANIVLDVLWRATAQRPAKTFRLSCVKETPLYAKPRARLSSLCRRGCGTPPTRARRARRRAAPRRPRRQAGRVPDQVDLGEVWRAPDEWTRASMPGRARRRKGEKRAVRRSSESSESVESRSTIMKGGPLNSVHAPALRGARRVGAEDLQVGALAGGPRSPARRCRPPRDPRSRRKRGTPRGPAGQAGTRASSGSTRARRGRSGCGRARRAGAGSRGRGRSWRGSGGRRDLSPRRRRSASSSPPGPRRRGPGRSGRRERGLPRRERGGVGSSVR